MRTLSLSPLSQLASLAPLAVRVIAGIIMLAHGWQKLTEMGPGNFGGQISLDWGPPAGLWGPCDFWIIGGILLIGVLIAARPLLLTDMVVAILLVQVNVGFTPEQRYWRGARPG